MESDLKIRVSRREDVLDQSTPPSSGLAQPTGMQRATLQFALTISSFVLALGGVAVSFYIFRTGLQALQHAQTEVQKETARKVQNEVQTTAVEAEFAQRLTALQLKNENLRTELLSAQSALARAERVRNEAETGLRLTENQVAGLEAKLKEFQVSIASVTQGNPRLQAMLAKTVNDFATRSECRKPNDGESAEDYNNRCPGGRQLLVPPRALNDVTGIPIGLTGGARPPRPPR